MKGVLGEGEEEGLIFVVSAPAGTGKTTLVQKLMKEFPSVIASISYTTRPPRDGEINGVHYHFISEPEFQEKILASDFLEYVKLYETYYGTSLQWVKGQQRLGKHVVLVIDTQGAMQLKNRLQAIYIFIKPPSIDSLRKRLTDRQTETQEMIEKRLEWAENELKVVENYDYQIVNDDLETAYQILRSIFIAECHRTNRIMHSKEINE